MFTADWSQWPLAVLRFSESFTHADEAPYLVAVQRLADAREPYVVILITQGDEHFQQASRIKNNMIFKHNREQLARWCRQLYRVKLQLAPNDTDDAKLQKAMPFPAMHVSSEAEATRLARDFLANRLCQEPPE
jgi:hypothetical protein